MRDGRWWILGSAVCFGTTGTAQAIGDTGASPVSLGAARVVIGAALLVLAVALVRRYTRTNGHTHGDDGQPVTRSGRLGRGVAGLVAAGAVGVAAYQPTFFLAVERTGVAVGTVVALGSAPVLTGALEAAVRRTSGHGAGQGAGLDRRWAAGTALSIGGLAVLVGASGSGRVDLAGVVLAVGAGASYACYAVVTPRLLERGLTGPESMAAQFTGAAVLLAPVFLLLPVAWLGTGRGVTTAVFLGLVPTALAYLMFAQGLRTVAPHRAATLTLAEPLVATVLGIVLLHERPGAAAALGGLLLVAGLVVSAVREAEVVPA